MKNQSTTIPEHVNYLMTLMKSYEAYFRKNVGTIDINIGEIPILLAIYTDEGLNQIDLVKKFHVTEANISKTTKNLLYKGLIVKKVDAENNTKKLLFLTEEGQKVCAHLLEIFEDWKNEMRGDISMDELYSFSQTLKKISINAANSF